MKKLLLLILTLKYSIFYSLDIPDIDLEAYNIYKEDQKKKANELAGVMKQHLQISSLSILVSEFVMPSSYEEWQKSGLGLILPAISNNVEAINKLLDLGVNINASEANGITPLMYASYHGNLEAVRVLLKSGANINAKDSRGWTALMYAAQFGKLKIVEELLLNQRINVHEKNTRNWTALICASNENHSEIIKLLKKYDSNENCIIL